MAVDQEKPKQLPAVMDSVTAYPALSSCDFQDGSMVINSFPAIYEFAKLATGCGFFEDTKTAQQAIIKISWGTSVGLSPLESINDVYVNRGKFGIWAKSIAARIKKHPRYDYEVVENTDKQCVLKCFIDGKAQKDLVKYTMEQAIAAGVTGNKPWKVAPARMLFYKAITEAYIIYFGDVFKGVVNSTEDIQDFDFSESYKKERPELVKQTAQEVANERAAEQSKKLDKVFDEALDVDTVDEIPFEDSKPQPQFEDRMEARARVAESEGDTKAAEETRKEAQKIADLKAEIKAVKWSDVILKATTTKYGGPKIKAWLEKRGVDCTKPAEIPQEQLQAAMAELEQPKK